MKRRDPGHLLGKVDGSKRDFMRKLALGTAYAVPAISTFSLDGMRSKAHAQGGYVAPAVLGLGVVSGSGLSLINGYTDKEGDLCVEPFMFVITYNRPMAKSYSTAKKYIFQQYWSPLTPPCGTEPTGAQIPSPPAGCPGGTGLTWLWNADGTKEYAQIPNNGTSTRLYLWLNHPSCAQNTLYRDPTGELMTPFFDIADLCSPNI